MTPQSKQSASAPNEHPKQITSEPQVLSILGSTGSIGTSTLAVLDHHPEHYRVYALAAHSQYQLMFEQCLQYQPEVAVLIQVEAAEKLRQLLKEAGSSTRVECGDEAVVDAAKAHNVTTVVAAIVGAAGLRSTLAAVAAGKRLLLANKESLVMSGDLLMDSAKASGSLVMPVDSEHNAIFQCLPQDVTGVNLSGVEKILLTASGGPFRNWSRKELSVVTPQQALKHPNWSMGPKVTIDSSTLMNKGLELIEACHLFGVGADDIEVLVHPQSVVHSMVAYSDGSVIAQLGRPDMRTPIAHALSWPHRIHSGVQSLDFLTLANLTFEAPDLTSFPCLRLAMEAQREGGTAPTVLNAANEVCVDAFLNDSVAFLQLPEIVEYTLSQAKITPAVDLPTIINADNNAREIASEKLSSLSC